MFAVEVLIFAVAMLLLGGAIEAWFESRAIKRQLKRWGVD